MDLLNVLTVVWLVALTLFVMLNFGYLLLTFVLAKTKKKPVRGSYAFKPFISILIPCYNTESVIDQKVANTLSIEYPKNKFEVVIVESGSTDNTYSSLSRYASDRKIKMIREPRRLGKSSAVSQGLKICKGDIVVLTDADARLEPRAIRELVKNFADESIGAVVGNLDVSASKSLASKMNRAFHDFFRRKLRIWESAFDSASFWSGELCAFRKSLLEGIDEDIVNDDRYILLKIRSKGYRCICESSARVYEPDAEDIAGQIMHRRRTTAGTIQGSLKFKHMLFNSKYGLFGMLIFPSHLFRVILLPLLLLVVEGLSPFGALFLWSSTALSWLGAGVVILASLSLFEKGRELLYSLIYGIFVQIAMLLGIADYILRRHTVLWPRIAKPMSF